MSRARGEPTENASLCDLVCDIYCALYVYCCVYSRINCNVVTAVGYDLAQDGSIA